MSRRCGTVTGWAAPQPAMDGTGLWSCAEVKGRRRRRRIRAGLLGLEPPTVYGPLRRRGPSDIRPLFHSPSITDGSPSVIAWVAGHCERYGPPTIPPPKRRWP